MESVSLVGRSILIVEDEPMIAFDIGEACRKAGAEVMTAGRLRDGLRLAKHPDLSAAILDLGLSDGDGTALCEMLSERGVPFILHSGYDDIAVACHAGVMVPKPATAGELVSTIGRLLGPPAVAASD